MPFRSQAQQRYMFANKAKLEKQGVDVDEWAKSTDYSHLPIRKKKFSHVPGRKKQNS